MFRCFVADDMGSSMFYKGTQSACCIFISGNMFHKSTQGQYFSVVARCIFMSTTLRIKCMEIPPNQWLQVFSFSVAKHSVKLQILASISL